MGKQKQKELLEHISKEELATALVEVIGYITPLIEAAPSARFEAYCPRELIGEDDPDEIWRAGQTNGQAYTAREILTTINRAMGLKT